MAFSLIEGSKRYTDPNCIQSGVDCNDLYETRSRYEGTDARQLAPEDRRDLNEANRALSERRLLWDAIVSEAGTRFSNVNLRDFQLLTDEHRQAVSTMREYLGRFPECEANLILFGPVGAGKDHLMMAAVRYLTRKFGLVTAWFDGQAFFGAVRDAYSDNATETPIVRSCCRADLLAMSDPLPASGNLTDHQQNVLGRILDGRNRFLRPTLTTMNVATRDEMYDRLGDRNADRLRENAVMVPCNWPSFRLRPRLSVMAS